ncbi:MAG: DUF3592 domain-containing protein [Oscillospiraceae bacterium]|nr:DUF3592 domain-containing protein [Oscillospiraceae bacterium]
MFEIIFGIFAAIFAFAFLAVGVMALVGGAQQKRRCSATAAGVVSRIHAEEQHRGKRRVTIFTPEFQFEADGHTYTMKSHFGSMKREFKEGQAVTIRFDPADPAAAYVADDVNNSSQGGIMCVCFGLLLAVGAVMLFT